MSGVAVTKGTLTAERYAEHEGHVDGMSGVAVTEGTLTAERYAEHQGQIDAISAQPHAAKLG